MQVRKVLVTPLAWAVVTGFQMEEEVEAGPTSAPAAISKNLEFKHDVLATVSSN